MNKFAEIKYGKIIAILEDYKPLEVFREAHAPDKYWIDVTGMDCKVGDVIEFKDGIGLVIKHTTTNSLETLKASKINDLKTIQYVENQQPIEYEFKFYDYNEQSKWKILEKIYSMEVSGEYTTKWHTAYNEEVELTAYDLKCIIAEGAKRTALVHDKYSVLKSKVENCATLEEVYGVDW